MMKQESITLQKIDGIYDIQALVEPALSLLETTLLSLLLISLIGLILSLTWKTLYSKKSIEKMVHIKLSLVGLENYVNYLPSEISGGMKKRAGLARALALNPAILFLDEPTIGQDARQKENLAEMLMDLNEKGRTVIVVTHDIEFVIENFPRTIAMANGTIIADGPTNSVLSNDKVIKKCSLTAPQLTQAARSLHEIFPKVPERLTLLSELENEIVRVLGGA